MNRNDIVGTLERETGIERRKIRRMIDLLLEPRCGLIPAALERGERVTLEGFGTFDVRDIGARLIRLPHKSQSVSAHPIRVVVFRPGVRLRARIR
ncbi:MAG TPA: HU family DNA-binding protein [Acidobacteriota bacterium]|nr:HU family DNA-binding protein [Acidobacteriota bacterium]